MKGTTAIAQGITREAASRAKKRGLALDASESTKRTKVQDDHTAQNDPIEEPRVVCGAGRPPWPPARPVRPIDLRARLIRVKRALTGGHGKSDLPCPRWLPHGPPRRHGSGRRRVAGRGRNGAYGMSGADPVGDNGKAGVDGKDGQARTPMAQTVLWARTEAAGTGMWARTLRRV
jgi:hypothetical protein